MTREGDCGARTKELIARYYLALMGEFRTDSGMLYLSMDSADMFHNAITLILQDNGFQKLVTDEDIMEKIRARISYKRDKTRSSHFKTGRICRQFTSQRRRVITATPGKKGWRCIILPGGRG